MLCWGSGAGGQEPASSAGEGHQEEAEREAGAAV